MSVLKIDGEVLDPHGEIAKIKKRLPSRCAAKNSKYVDFIIALRLQGNSFKRISEWLQSKGEEHYISPVALSQSFKNLQQDISLPYAEELAEKYGGDILDLDLVHELSRQVVIQRRRIDRMMRDEEEGRKKNPHYSNRSLRREMETLAMLVKVLHGMLKGATEAAMERAKTDAEQRADGADVDEQLLKMLEKAILDGDVENTGIEDLLELKTDIF